MTWRAFYINLQTVSYPKVVLAIVRLPLIPLTSYNRLRRVAGACFDGHRTNKLIVKALQSKAFRCLRHECIEILVLMIAILGVIWGGPGVDRLDNLAITMRRCVMGNSCFTETCFLRESQPVLQSLHKLKLLTAHQHLLTGFLFLLILNSWLHS